MEQAIHILMSRIDDLLQTGCPDDSRMQDDARVCWYCQSVIKSDLNAEYWNARIEPHRPDCVWFALFRDFTLLWQESAERQRLSTETDPQGAVPS